MNNIIRLYPQPVSEIPLVGAYLAHNLRQNSGEQGNPFIYANFLASIDGRIATPRPGGDGVMVPKATANGRDWRLFQELAAQADIILSSGRYLREWAAGRAQEILRVDDPQFTDLRAWRETKGLATQPDIAIISGSLDFPIPAVLSAGGRKVVVFTTANPDTARVKEIEAHSGQVIIAGEKSVNGAILAKRLKELEYHTIYSAAGPKVLHLLASGGALSRLYLTQANRLLGGQPYASIIEGPLLNPPINLKLYQIYLDAYALDGSGQLFVSYNPA
jgi:riboflavin biosynthesis pyrimidine reductase